MRRSQLLACAATFCYQLSNFIAAGKASVGYRNTPYIKFLFLIIFSNGITRSLLITIISSPDNQGKVCIFTTGSNGFIVDARDRMSIIFLNVMTTDSFFLF